MNIENILIESKAFHINTKDLFTWASGLKSPFYCNNRLLISYPQFRDFIVDKFIENIKQEYPHVEAIAGTSTAGIPWAAFISQKLNLPMLYIRSIPKEHGLKSCVEGKIIENQKILIIEDLISTGKSSLQAYQNAKNDKLNPLGILAIFSYGHKKAKDVFEEANIKYHSLCTLDSFINYLEKDSAFTQKEILFLKQWKKDFLL